MVPIWRLAPLRDWLHFETGEGEPRRLALSAPRWGEMKASDRFLALLAEQGFAPEESPRESA